RTHCFYMPGRTKRQSIETVSPREEAMRYLVLLFTMMIILPLATPAKAEQAPAEKFVQDLGNQALATMADKNLDQDRRAQKYRDLLRNAFDLQTIGHFVLGRTWNTATPEQRQAFLNQFEQTVLETYGSRMNFYSGQSFKVKGSRQESENDTVVTSE